MINKTINKSASKQLIIKKSKFIGFVFKVENNDQINTILTNLKKEYSDATHICYAYILNEDTFKFYDDGEPSSSAGVPLLKVLQYNKLIYTLAVVIRYYGGVKLGVGGLIRAYSNTIKETLKETNLINYTIRESYLLSCQHKDYESIIYLIEKHKGVVISKEFGLNIDIKFSLDSKQIDKLKKDFNFSLDIRKVLN